MITDWPRAGGNCQVLSERRMQVSTELSFRVELLDFELTTLPWVEMLHSSTTLPANPGFFSSAAS